MDTTPKPDTARVVKRRISAPLVGHGRLWEIISTNPSLHYLSQTESHYLVKVHENTPVYVPKNREVTAPYPPRTLSPLADSYRWLSWSAIGLLFAGIITVFAAPVVVATAIPALGTDQKRHALTVIFSAVMLFAVGIVFSGLLVMHFIY